MNIATGQKRLVLKNEGFLSFVVDEEYAVRFGIRMSAEGGQEWLVWRDERWEPFLTVPLDDVTTTAALGFDREGAVLYLKDSRGRETAALTSINLASGKQAVVSEDLRADLADVVIHPVTRALQAAAFMVERKRWQVLDEHVSARFSQVVASPE